MFITTAAQEALARKFVTGELQANLEPVYSFQGSQEAYVDLPASTLFVRIVPSSYSVQP